MHLTCWRCGARVSNDYPDTTNLIVRGTIECPECAEKDEPLFKVGVGVGVALIRFVMKGSWAVPHVLLGKRKGAHGEGQYSLPGGRLEPDESPIRGAIRELKEETGLDFVRDLESLSVDTSVPFNNVITGGQPWTTLYFTGEIKRSAVPRVMEPDKCEGWDFVSTDGLPAPLFNAFYAYAHSKGWNVEQQENWDSVHQGRK